MKAIMIDIETLDVLPTAHILSIGACVVSPENLRDIDKFYIELADDQPERTISASTVRFWKDQQLPLPNGKSSISTALADLCQFIDFHRAESVDGKLEIWCKGMDFDTAILKHAYTANSWCDLPWKYSEVRDYRTLAKEIFWIKPDEVNGKLHNALEDALHQAAHLHKIKNALAYILAEKDAKVNPNAA